MYLYAYIYICICIYLHISVYIYVYLYLPIHNNTPHTCFPFHASLCVRHPSGDCDSSCSSASGRGT